MGQGVGLVEQRAGVADRVQSFVPNLEHLLVGLDGLGQILGRMRGRQVLQRVGQVHLGAGPQVRSLVAVVSGHGLAERLHGNAHPQLVRGLAGGHGHVSQAQVVLHQGVKFRLGAFVDAVVQRLLIAADRLQQPRATPFGRVMIGQTQVEPQLRLQKRQRRIAGQLQSFARQESRPMRIVPRLLEDQLGRLADKPSGQHGHGGPGFGDGLFEPFQGFKGPLCFQGRGRRGGEHHGPKLSAQPTWFGHLIGVSVIVAHGVKEHIQRPRPGVLQRGPLPRAGSQHKAVVGGKRIGRFDQMLQSGRNVPGHSQRKETPWPRELLWQLSAEQSGMGLGSLHSRQQQERGRRVPKPHGLGAQGNHHGNGFPPLASRRVG